MGERMANDAIPESGVTAQDGIPASPVVLDYVYNQVDKTYYEFARASGLSSCAFWMVYDLYQAHGQLEMRVLGETWAYSKQTINSALKTLEERGLIDTAYVAGSRRNKVVTLTDKGAAFARRYLRPAVESEWRAFDSLEPRERQTLVRLLKKYASALEREMAAARSAISKRAEDAKGR